MENNEIKDLRELLLMIDAKIEHIEDTTADNRAIIVKLVKQSNEIVKFLSQIDISVNDVIEDYHLSSPLPNSERNNDQLNKMRHIKELVNEYMAKHKDLIELEEELKKNKDKLTPGQVGEA